MLESILNRLLTSPILKEGVDDLNRNNIKISLFSIISEVEEHINIIKNKINDNYLQNKNTYGKQLSTHLEKNISYFFQMKVIL